MLGQLFHSFNSAKHGSPRSSTPLDSEIEEHHTRNLLFPDVNFLHQADGPTYPLPNNPALSTAVQGTGSDGNAGGIDLESPRDIRILIAQNEAGSLPRVILFDSKFNGSDSPSLRPGRSAGVSEPPRPAGSSMGRTHSRRSSAISESPGRRSPGGVAGSAFQRRGLRNTSISSMPNIDELSQSRFRESEEMVKTCLECMFENTQMSYKGPSNKIHIVPLEPKPVDQPIISPTLTEGPGSFGKAEGRKRSNLAQSYTPADPLPELPKRSSEPPFIPQKLDRRRTVFVTRTFSVTLPDEDESTDGANESTPTPSTSLGNKDGFPFPVAGVGSKGNATFRSRRRQRTAPMYAISLIIQLPVASPSAVVPLFRSGIPPHRTGTRAFGSLQNYDSPGSSLESDGHGSWSFVDPTFGVESMLSATFGSDVDDRVGLIGQHWDIISRTLMSLQFIVQEKILKLLQVADVASPPIPVMARAAATRQELVQQPRHRRNVKLQPLALMDDEAIRQAADQAGSRVVRGIKIFRVVTGQGRWGIWREEARWLGRWAGGKEQNFFFFNILTAFLGNHTEWLSILGPKWARRRHREQQKSNPAEDLSIPSRTVIVSSDKMAARRLVFLLSAFLPASHSSYEGYSPRRPGTSASFRAYSQSPPTNIGLSRQESLRRTINRKGKAKSVQMRHAGPSSEDETSRHHATDDRSDVEVSDSGRRSRRPSEARSVLQKNNLTLVAEADPTTRKSSATTTSTITPSAPVPTAHFAHNRADSVSSANAIIRPGSSGSLASANLINALQRDNSGNSNTDSQSASRWGSLKSFWSLGTRRESSTDQSDVLQTSDEGLGISGVGSIRSSVRQKHTKLEQMVNEVGVDRELYQEDFEDSEPPSANATQPSPDLFGMSGDASPSLGRPIPERPKSLTFPPELKLSVNKDDGVIDVEIPFLTSDSPTQSPLLGGFNTSSSHGASSFGPSSICSHAHRESEHPINVAGWLTKFHPDFALQAVRPYNDLEKDIRRAMSAEPTPAMAATTPTLEQGPADKWVDVCSSLIADSHNFSIKRLRLRRLVRLIPAPSQPAVTPGLHAVPTRSRYGDPYTCSSLAPALPMSELHLDEQFVEERIMDIDPTLVDAVERVLAQSSRSSRAHSTTSSRASSQRGGRADEPADNDGGGLSMPDIPRGQCKDLVLGALDKVVKAVTKEMERREELGEESDTSQGRRREDATDSTLREGVKKWLSEVVEPH